MSNECLGVGLIGAGPVVQAIHLPALARIPDLFEVRNIMDVDPAVVSPVAARAGATASSSVDELLADPTVEVVAICSPPRFHTDQAIAAMRAGKRAVLCEKPLATTSEDAERIAEVSRETGVPLIVGAMHLFDPSWAAARSSWGDLAESATLIRSRILLPPNSRFEDFATEVVDRPPSTHTDRTDPATRAALIEGGILGLAIHNLPLVRSFLPDGCRPTVTSARLLEPWGYLVTLDAGDRAVQLLGMISDRWRADWTFEVHGPDRTISARFPPSYVQAGSATTTIRRTGGRSTTFGPYDSNGYEHEWRTLHALALGRDVGAPTLTELLQDLELAAGIASAAAAHLTEVTA